MTHHTITETTLKTCLAALASTRTHFVAELEKAEKLSGGTRAITENKLFENLNEITAAHDELFNLLYDGETQKKQEAAKDPQTFSGRRGFKIIVGSSINICVMPRCGDPESKDEERELIEEAQAFCNEKQKPLRLIFHARGPNDTISFTPKQKV